MNVPNDRLLASYRSAGLCELCGAVCKMRCAMHIFSRGAGRVDTPLNLIKTAIDPFSGCDCHHRSHATGKPSRMDMLRVVSKREGVALDLIEPTIQAVRACKRYSTFQASSLWLREHFPQDVAEAAIAIVKGVYEI